MATGRWTFTFSNGDQPSFSHVGPLTLYAQRVTDEWHLAAVRHDAGHRHVQVSAASGDDLSALDWRRWVVDGGDRDIRLSPATPDRSVVVRPDYQLTLPPGQQATFYVTFPVWIRVTAGPADVLLCEEAPITLSKIWFGDFLSGEVCYSLKTRARRSFDREGTDDYRAICPVTVTNRSATDLLLERICIRTAHLTLFDDAGVLWASEVTAVFQGDEHVARLSYGEKPPGECAQAEAVFPAREVVQGNLLRKTFQRMKWLSV